MVSRTAALAAAFFLSTAVAAHAASAPGGRGSIAPSVPSGDNAQIWTSLSAAQAEQLVLEAGGTITDRLEGTEGFSLNFEYANGYFAYIEGFDCTGTGLDAVCGEIELGAVYTADDAAHALRMERELNLVWLADVADVEASELIVWRRDCLHAGVTRGQALHWLIAMEEQLVAVGQVMWPDDGTAREPGTVET